MTDSIREALTAAVDKHSGPADDTSADEADDTPISNADAADSAELPADKADEASAPSDSDESSEAASDATTPAAPAPVATTETPPPASWSNEERAAWATVPESARKAIQRRETEMNRAFQSSAAARRRVADLDKMADVYKPLLDSYGVTVEQAMPGLLATRAVLEVGTMQQKTALLANLCADFGIDIGELDNALTQRYQGGVPTPKYTGVQQPQPNFRNDPNLAPLYALAERANEHTRAQAQAMVDAVKSDPHFEAVRHTMADFIDQAKANGREIDLPTALRLARELHGLGAPAPVRGSTGNPVSDAARTLALARNAASSVSGAPKPAAPRKPGEGTIRDEIIANMGRKSR